MDNVIELAREAGFKSPDFYKLTVSHTAIETIERFYTLARTDLEAEMQEQCRINGMGAERELKLMAENAKLKQMYALLASAWFYGGWEAETHNERLMQKLMQEAGYWPTTEEEIVARAALGEK